HKEAKLKYFDLGILVNGFMHIRSR
ncbi:hypothetical protein LCGC14_1707090, partial [marine sediment metagenome]